MVPPIINSVIWFWGVLLAISVISALLINTFIKPEIRQAHRMVTQPTLTVVGMLFSVLLGFFIAQSMRNYGEMNARVTQEANALGDLFRFARGLEAEDRVRIRRLCREYAQVVVDEEWPMMANCEDSDKAWAVNQKLWEAILIVQRQNPNITPIYQKVVDSMDDLGECRRWRISMANSGLAPELWLIIACGAGAIVALTFIFAPESRAFHCGILACIVIPISINVYLLSEYVHPFSGALAIQPTTFRLLQRRLFINPDTAPGKTLEWSSVKK